MPKPEKMPSGYFGWAIIDGEAGINSLKSVMHNLEDSPLNNPDYARGILIGVVSTLMATGMSFDDSIQLVWQTMPNECQPNCFPDGWRQLFEDKISR